MENTIPSRLRSAVAAAPRFVGAGPPDRRRSLERYGAMAEAYDKTTRGGHYYRRQAVARLAPMPGEVILDVGCGTGLNFAALRHAIGPTGRLIGVEHSPETLGLARARIASHGWTNVEIVQADAGEAAIDVMADGALLCAVHDVMRSPAALVNVLRHLRDRARVVAGGPKWAPLGAGGALSMNFRTWRMNRPCVTTFEGFRQPWSYLELLVDNLVVDEVFLGGGYIASGTRPRTR
ncbi:MAG TPA: methyltransferase domain-containing protein [Solirubrobacteraceae bacterium]|nr:methyltransferase domain-containing protein [Solirubrobacteraceae bacterium]